MIKNNISEFKLHLLNYNWSALYRIDNAHAAFGLLIYILDCYVIHLYITPLL